MTAMAEPPTHPAETFAFQADVKQLLHLVVHSLYSNKEIFLRELVSNASDAIDKVKFRSLTEHDLLGDDKELRIRIVPDGEGKTLTIDDTGVGMTKEELQKNLGTIAHSGTRAFLEKAKEKGGAVNLIGEFGVGFYSSFLVADKVEVVTRAAGASEAWKWTSDAQGAYSIEPADRPSRGTSVTLHLRADHRDFVDEWRLRELISRYSDYVSHPIQLLVEKSEDSDLEVPGETPEEKAKREKRKVKSYETINKASALWQRPKSEITDEQYAEFYKHLTHDFDPPLARAHFTVEGTQLFTGLLFVPKRPPFDLYDRNKRRGVRLYVKRVFIMDDCEELLPEWLRFLRGIIDSDDLPLNVSREILQKEGMVKTIKKSVIKKSLEMLEELSTSKPDDYKAFITAYGSVLKEGLHFDWENKEKIAKLCRFTTTKGEHVALKDYVAGMPSGQDAIYYVIAESKKAAAGSPHLEGLKKKGYEVLLLSDAVDEWAVEGLREFEGKKLVSAMKANLKLDATEEAKKAQEETAKQLTPLTARFQEILSEHVKEVRVSDRLTDSPCCLVVPEGGMHAHMERLLRAHDRDVPATKRILELNPDHAIVKSLEAVRAKDPRDPKLSEWVSVLYDQALIAEGSPVDDPAAFAKRISSLLAETASRAAS